MNCHISSDKLSNPLLKELLAVLTSYFSSIKSEYYVIGATARDIVLTAIHEQDAKRSTTDLDIAIAIPNWKDFESIEKGLRQIAGFEKSKSQRQRFIYKDIYLLDIVPFGGVAKEDENIYWPPKEEVAMSVAGFPEATNDVLEVDIDNEFSVKVVQLPGIFLLKLNAFEDRHLGSNKDAEEESVLINQMLETHAALKYEEVFAALQNILNQLR